MDSLNKMVLGENNKKVYDARLLIADNYNVLVDKINETISNIPIILTGTQEWYDALDLSLYSSNTYFFIIG